MASSSVGLRARRKSAAMLVGMEQGGADEKVPGDIRVVSRAE